MTPDMEEIEYAMVYRIPKIENLEQCVNLRVRWSVTSLEAGIEKELDQEN